MEQRHKEYIEYYFARMKKYENNPNYKNTYLAEKNMYEAIKNVETLEDFREIESKEKLSLKCAIALIKDRETMRLKYYNQMKEYVRAKAPGRILAIIDSVIDIMDLTSKINEIENEVNREITIDSFIDAFMLDFTVIENIEQYDKVKLPGEWEAEKQSFFNQTVNSFKVQWSKILDENRKWQSGWDLNYNTIFEERHRRKIPVPDEVIKERIALHKKYRGI